MSRTGPVTIVAFLLLLSVAAPALGMSTAPADEQPGWQQTATTTSSAGANETATENPTSPGARLGGLVAAQGVAVGSEVESRSLRHRLNRSASNESKAAVVAQQVNRSQSRLDALQAERERLETAYEAGRISENEYRVRATRLSARISAVRRLNTQTTDVADRLPQETLRQTGVDVTALRSVRSRADEVEGPEIAAIAREIAGPQRGLGPPEDDEERGRNGERGEGEGRPDSPGGGADERPGGGPPDESQRQSTGNETADDGEPTPRGNGQGGSNDGSAGERGQGNGSENAGNDGNQGRGNDDAGNSGNENAGNGNGGDENGGNDDAGNSGNDGQGNSGAGNADGDGENERRGNDESGNGGEGRGNDSPGDSGNNGNNGDGDGGSDNSGNRNDGSGNNGDGDDGAADGGNEGRGNGGNGNPGRAAIQ